jgi:hypothetical protein
MPRQCSRLSSQSRNEWHHSFPVDKETLKYVLVEAESRPLPTVAPRALQLPLTLRKVVTLVGIRGSGKTYLLYDTMRRLEAEGVDRRRMVYLSFEDGNHRRSIASISGYARRGRSRPSVTMARRRKCSRGAASG